MTDFLVRYSTFRDARAWKGETPVYHLQVQTTVGGQNLPFVISAAHVESARRFRILEGYPQLATDVFILVRVSDLYTSARAFFYIDPWEMYTRGALRLRPETDSYVAEIDSPEPHIVFGDFGYAGGRGDVVPQPRQGLLGYIFEMFRLADTASLEGDGGGVSGGAELPSTKRFVYRPLPGRRTIRLLELYPGTGLDELRGQLCHVSIDSKPAFQAISYAWGYSIKPFILRTPDGPMGITASLCFGLRRLRQRQSSVLIWADAICIDQSSDEEKSRQIRLIPEIYKTARQVTAWIGEESDGSRHAIECLKTLALLQPRVPVASVLPEDSAAWDAINSFFGRPWFQRVWVVQELVLAPRVMVMCGDRWVGWGVVYAAAEVCSREGQVPTHGVMKQITQRVAAVINLGSLRHRYQEGVAASRDADGGGAQERMVKQQQPQLLSLLYRFQHTKATLQRDKLFAMLGLACDSLDESLNPDYRAPLEQVVRRYAGVFVRQGHGLRLLYRAGFSSSRFPSWIPDWITNIPRHTITTWASNPGRLSSASTGAESSITLSPDDDKVLIASGYILDSLEKVGETSFQTADRIQYLQELSGFVRSRSSYPTGESLEDLAWKIPIGDAIEPTTPPSPSSSAAAEPVDFRVAYQAFTEYLLLGDQQVTDWKTEMMEARAMAKIKQFLFRPQELRQLLWPYLQTALSFSEHFSADARPGVTVAGYVGIVPGMADKGDVVVVFGGGCGAVSGEEERGTPGVLCPAGRVLCAWAYAWDSSCLG